jgi:hydrogenase nickel incorporation protein HypA/HybF
MGLALEIIEVAARSAEGRRVLRVKIEVGRLAAVLPDALRFSFDVAKSETPLAEATLDIIETQGLGRCRACDGKVVLERPFGRCSCGSTDLEWLSGDELKIKELEVV